jgi:hypothetical protein
VGESAHPAALAKHFILDHGGFADAGLRGKRTCRERKDGTERKKKQKGVTRFHFKADRLSRYRTGRACDVADLSQAAPY